jgi:hypothetical protein
MNTRTSLIVVMCLFAAGRASAEHPELGWLTYTGAGSCASPCHVGGDWNMEDVARQFTHSLHYQWKAGLPAATVFNEAGQARSGAWGLLNRVDPLGGTLASQDWISLRQPDNPGHPDGQPGGCARCHTSVGATLPAALNEESWRGVDCLICHASVYQLNGQPMTDASRRPVVVDETSPTGYRLVQPVGGDLALTTGSITAQPSTQACQRCHGRADSERNRRSSHDFMSVDAHADAGLGCVDCHQAEGHAFAGRPHVSQWATERPGTAAATLVTCAGCHSSSGQQARPDLDIPIPGHALIPGNHFATLACEACHIGSTGGLAEVRHDRLVRETSGGRFLRWRTATAGGGDHFPVYRWSNGTLFDTDLPRGTPFGFGNKITPFHRLAARVPVDAASGRQLPLDNAVIGNADSLMTNFTSAPLDTSGLLELAVRRGVRKAAQADAATWGSLVNEDGDYLAAWRWEEREQYLPVRHGTLPAGETLWCMDCHGAAARIDWTALGLDGDPYVLDVADPPRPDGFQLGPCRPNPFNNSTLVPFTLPQSGLVDLTVHDLQGRLVLTVLKAAPRPAGRHEAQIAGDRLPSGVYLYRLRAGRQELTGKMLLVK